jgi:hypothetical protein
MCADAYREADLGDLRESRVVRDILNEIDRRQDRSTCDVAGLPGNRPIARREIHRVRVPDLLDSTLQPLEFLRGRLDAISRHDGHRAEEPPRLVHLHHADPVDAS